MTLAFPNNENLIAFLFTFILEFGGAESDNVKSHATLIIVKKKKYNYSAVYSQVVGSR